MVYQRKQRSEDQQIPIPQVQNSLFASPDLETDESANSYTGAAASDGLSAEAKLKHAEQHGHNFADISIFPKEGAVQRKRSIHPLQAKFFPNPDVVRQELSLPMVQTKLTVGAAGDKYEQEADRVAANVVDMIHRPVAESPVQRSLEEDGMPPQMWPQMRIQRYNQNDHVQTKLTPNQIGKEGGAASEDVTSEIERAKGGGQKLDQGLQRSMGKAMGTDFGGVRIHTDATSDRINQTIQAKAFTTGSDVFFRQGQYNPGTKSGQQLIAHELTHVVQQGQAIQRTFAPEEEAQIKNIKVSDEEELQKKPDDNAHIVGGDNSKPSGLIQRKGHENIPRHQNDQGTGNISITSRSRKSAFDGGTNLSQEQKDKLSKGVKDAQVLADRAIASIGRLEVQVPQQGWAMASMNSDGRVFEDEFAGQVYGDQEAIDMLGKAKQAYRRSKQGLSRQIKIVETNPAILEETKKQREKQGESGESVGYVKRPLQEVDSTTSYDADNNAKYNKDKGLIGWKNTTTKYLTTKSYALIDVPFLGPQRPGSIHVKFGAWLSQQPQERVSNLILHEATHKFANTYDHGYGEGQGLKLEPKKAVENADSYPHFARNLS